MRKHLKSVSAMSREELEWEVSELRMQLGLHVQTKRISAVRKHFPVYPAACRILIFLYDLKRPLPTHFLREHCLTEDAMDSTLKVYVSHIRKALRDKFGPAGAPYLQTRWWGAYELTPQGRKALKPYLETSDDA